MTAEEISKIEIKSLRDGRSWVSVVNIAMRTQVEKMHLTFGYDNEAWNAAETEHWKLRNQKHRIQKDMVKFVKVKSGQK